MKTVDEAQLRALIADWRKRADGLKQEAHKLERKQFRSKTALNLMQADYFGKAVAYLFAALDLEAKLK